MTSDLSTIFIEKLDTQISNATFADKDAERAEDHEWFRCWEQLSEIYSLEDDWDGAGARPIGYPIIDSAADILRQLRRDPASTYPSPNRIVPTPGGSVSIEWEYDDLYLEAEIVEPYEIEWMLEYPNGSTLFWTETMKRSLDVDASTITHVD